MIMTECKSIDEVRENIDSIDREIVRLLSERRRYVKQAAGFKKTREDVRAPKRVEEVIANDTKSFIVIVLNSSPENPCLQNYYSLPNGFPPSLISAFLP